MFEKGIEWSKKDELNAKSLPVVICTNAVQSAFGRKKRAEKKDIKTECCRFFFLTNPGVMSVEPWEHENDFNEEDLFLIVIRFLFYLAATSRIL